MTRLYLASPFPPLECANTAPGAGENSRTLDGPVRSRPLAADMAQVTKKSRAGKTDPFGTGKILVSDCLVPHRARTPA